jgi:RNA pseudouridylate synthase
MLIFFFLRNLYYFLLFTLFIFSFSHLHIKKVIFTFFFLKYSSFFLLFSLDRPCSGVVIFAKSLFAANKLNLSFKNRLTDKNYLAVLNGKIEHFDSKFYHHMIEKTQNSKVRIYDIVKSGENNKSNRNNNNEKDNKNKSRNDNNNHNNNNNNNKQNNNIELIDAKLYMNAALIIQGGADKNNLQTLVNVELKTGRKHQIRAQMSHIGKYK